MPTSYPASRALKRATAASAGWHTGHQYAVRLSSPCPRELDRRPAARARPAGAPYTARAVGYPRPSTHRRARPLRGRRRNSRRVAAPSGSHGESRTSQSVSDIHMFPMPATSRWSWSTSPSGRARRHGGSSGRARPDRSRPRAGPGRAGAPARCRASAPARSTASPRSPRHGGRATAGRSGRADRADAPATVHPQVAPHGDAALEPQDSAFRPPRPFEPAPSTAAATPVTARVDAGLRRRAGPDERLKSRGGAMERVAFGHSAASQQGAEQQGVELAS